MRNLEEEGKEFGNALLQAVAGSGVETELDNPQEAFQSGLYFGAVQGYKRGVNEMLKDVTDMLPDIFNKIAESNFNMSIDWSHEYRRLVMKNLYNISENQ